MVRKSGGKDTEKPGLGPGRCSQKRWWRTTSSHPLGTKKMRVCTPCTPKGGCTRNTHGTRGVLNLLYISKTSMNSKKEGCTGCTGYLVYYNCYVISVHPSRAHFSHNAKRRGVHTRVTLRVNIWYVESTGKRGVHTLRGRVPT